MTLQDRGIFEGEKLPKPLHRYIGSEPLPFCHHRPGFLLPAQFAVNDRQVKVGRHRVRVEAEESLPRYKGLLIPTRLAIGNA